MHESVRDAEKKPTAKEALQRLAEAERKLVIAKLEKEQMARKIDILTALFDAVLDSAATIGEARRWWADWTAQLNTIDPDSPDAPAHSMKSC